MGMCCHVVIMDITGGLLDRLKWVKCLVSHSVMYAMLSEFSCTFQTYTHV